MYVPALYLLRYQLIIISSLYQSYLRVTELRIKSNPKDLFVDIYSQATSSAIVELCDSLPIALELITEVHI